MPVADRPGDDALLQARPAIRLHVNYARVRPVDGRWFIEFTAPESATFNHETTGGRLFDAVVNGRAFGLTFVVGRFKGGPDLADAFSVGAGPNRVSKPDAIAIANSLTTNVTVARCSQSEIRANECS